MGRVVKVTVWSLGGLAGLVLIATAIGLAVPQSHSASVARTVPGSPDKVFGAISDVDGFASWRPEVDRAERLPDRGGLPTWRETGRTGSMTIEVVEVDEPRRLVTRIADDGMPFGGTWTYELEPAPGGTRVTITEDGEIYNPFYRFVARYVLGYEATMTAYLDALEARLGG